MIRTTKFAVVFTISIFLLSCMNNKTTEVSIVGESLEIDMDITDNGDTTDKLSNLDLLPLATTKQVIHHRYYSLSYYEEYEQAEWVAYELKKGYLINNDFRRPYFVEDPKVNSCSADWRNYKNSGYDKGHLCPAGDMEFDLNSYNDTFLTSNIAPQDHDFNAGIWNRLEQKVRYWAGKYDGVYVVTGGVLQPSLKTIGKEKVAVPNQFYKIVVLRSNDSYKMIAFLIPNRKSENSLFDYVVSVDLIESKTGIDFFPALNDNMEEKLEKSVDKYPWFAK
jgi:endonuclease G